MTTNPGRQIETREQLAAALRIAAELEHTLCCEYLFAAFTLRRTLSDFEDQPALDDVAKHHVMTLTQGWAIQILTIARQEMEHLAIVVNLQSALGEPPHLWRPNFPIPMGTYPMDAHLCLERLESHTLERFLYYERPDYLAKEVEFDDPGCCGGRYQRSERLELPSHGGLRFSSLQQLYEAIGGAYNGAGQLPSGELFRGSAAAQVQSGAMQWSSRVSVPQITNRAEAASAITQVIAEGEGIGLEPMSSSSHFSRFAAVRRSFEQLKRELPHADPALPVVCNPAAGTDIPDGATRVTDPAAERAMRLFDDGYFLMLAMLRGFFETYRGNFGTYPTFPNAPANSALFLEAFYPFMTMFIRPLGELLCRLPSAPDSKRHAGPAFALAQVPPGIQTLDWYVARFESLDMRSRELHEYLAAHQTLYGARAVQAAEWQWQALHRMYLNLPRLWQTGVLNP